MMILTPSGGGRPREDCPRGPKCARQVKRLAARRAWSRRRVPPRLVPPGLPIHAPVALVPVERVRAIVLPSKAWCRFCRAEEMYDVQTYVDTRGERIRLVCPCCRRARWADAVERAVESAA